MLTQQVVEFRNSVVPKVVPTLGILDHSLNDTQTH